MIRSSCPALSTSLQESTSPSLAAEISASDLYGKCRWRDSECPFGDMCNFAHGEHDLRPLPPEGEEILARKFQGNPRPSIAQSDQGSLRTGPPGPGSGMLTAHFARRGLPIAASQCRMEKKIRIGPGKPSSLRSILSVIWAPNAQGLQDRAQVLSSHTHQN